MQSVSINYDSTTQKVMLTKYLQLEKNDSLAPQDVALLYTLYTF